MKVTSDKWQVTGGRAPRAGGLPHSAFCIPHSVDPENRLLWRMNRSRLTAEMVRDSVLQMAGRLDLRMGGPSVVQFNNKGISETFMPTSGAPPYLDYEKFDPDAPENNRRAVYRFLFRSVP